MWIRRTSTPKSLVSSAVLVALLLSIGQAQGQVFGQLEEQLLGPSGSDPGSSVIGVEGLWHFAQDAPDHGWAGKAPLPEWSATFYGDIDSSPKDDPFSQSTGHSSYSPEGWPPMGAPQFPPTAGYDLGGGAWAVPEPATGLLLVVGAALLSVRRHRA